MQHEYPPDFIAKRKLTTNMSPEDFSEIIMPPKKNICGKREMLSFDMITRWFNIKDKLSITGKQGT